MAPFKLIVSCEHGGNTVPAAYRQVFSGRSDILASHRGYDIGALQLAKALAPLADFSQFCTVTRLLVELNRSAHHPKLFSEFTHGLPQESKQTIISQYYLPYRKTLAQQIAQYVNAKQRVIHISVHSFTPVLDGKTRNADIGFLYDPARAAEAEFAAIWRQNLRNVTGLRIRNNYPYQGKSDGLTTYLRKQFNELDYIGIELETNQALWQHSSASQKALRKLLHDTLRQATLDLIDYQK